MPPLLRRIPPRWSLLALVLVPAALLATPLAGSRSGAAAATPSPTPVAATASATPPPAASPTATPAAGGSVRLPGHTLASLARAQAQTRTPAAAGQPITITLVLARS